MCGIFGYVGNDQACDVVKAGLQKLEYRGYDSCGICLQDNDGFQIYKAIGDTSNLDNIQHDGTVGIGHTRWATHGTVSLKNTHPHISSCGNIVNIYI